MLSARPYSDYLKVNKILSLCITGIKIKISECWKVLSARHFYKNPCDLVSSLRATAESKNLLDLWRDGPENFASFTLKHIIEEDDEEVKSYFEIQDL